MARCFGLRLAHQPVGLLYAAVRGSLISRFDQMPDASIIVAADHVYLDHMRCRFAST